MFKNQIVSKVYQFLAALALSVIVPLALLGCKGDTSSQTKSLNNFARNSGDVARNVCSGDQKIVAGIHTEWDHVDFSRAKSSDIPKLKVALSNSLSAVPSNLQELFFGLGGKIVFNPNLAEPAKSSTDLSCDLTAEKSKFASEGTSKIEACWTVDPKTSNVVVLMNPTVDSVQHATVRMFGYILSQILTKIAVNDKGALVAQSDQAFDMLMGDIATAVIADIKRPGSKYNLKVNESLVNSKDFRYFAFAESFDSFYCNAGLRRSMARPDEFPKTHALFEQMDHELRKIQVVSKSTRQDNAAAETTFNLAGSEDQIGDGSEFNLGLLGGLFGALRGVGGLVAGAGRAVVGGAGGLLKGAVGGLGKLMSGAGGGLISQFMPFVQQIMGMFGGGG
jgi:hypothetical protein